MKISYFDRLQPKTINKQPLNNSNKVGFSLATVSFYGNGGLTKAQQEAYRIEFTKFQKSCENLPKVLKLMFPANGDNVKMEEAKSFFASNPLIEKDPALSKIAPLILLQKGMDKEYLTHEKELLSAFKTLNNPDDDIVIRKFIENIAAIPHEKLRNKFFEMYTNKGDKFVTDSKLLINSVLPAITDKNLRDEYIVDLVKNNSNVLLNQLYRFVPLVSNKETRRELIFHLFKEAASVSPQHISYANVMIPFLSDDETKIEFIENTFERLKNWNLALGEEEEAITKAICSISGDPKWHETKINFIKSLAEKRLLDNGESLTEVIASTNNDLLKVDSVKEFVNCSNINRGVSKLISSISDDEMKINLIKSLLKHEIRSTKEDAIKPTSFIEDNERKESLIAVKAISSIKDKDIRESLILECYNSKDQYVSSGVMSCLHCLSDTKQRDKLIEQSINSGIEGIDSISQTLSDIKDKELLNRVVSMLRQKQNLLNLTQPRIFESLYLLSDDSLKVDFSKQYLGKRGYLLMSEVDSNEKLILSLQDKALKDEYIKFLLTIPNRFTNIKFIEHLSNEQTKVELIRDVMKSGDNNEKQHVLKIIPSISDPKLQEDLFKEASQILGNNAVEKFKKEKLGTDIANKIGQNPLSSFYLDIFNEALEKAKIDNILDTPKALNAFSTLVATGKSAGEFRQILRDYEQLNNHLMQDSENLIPTDFYTIIEQVKQATCLRDIYPSVDLEDKSSLIDYLQNLEFKDFLPEEFIIENFKNMELDELKPIFRHPLQIKDKQEMIEKVNQQEIPPEEKKSLIDRINQAIELKDIVENVDLENRDNLIKIITDPKFSTILPVGSVHRFFESMSLEGLKNVFLMPLSQKDKQKILRDISKESKEFVIDHIREMKSTIINALIVTGKGLVVDASKKKFIKFNNFLNAVKSISDQENLLEPLSKTCRLSGSNSYTATKLMQIADGYCKAGKEDVFLNLLNEMNTTKHLDLEKLSKEFFELIAQECGLTDEEIKAIPPEKYALWDLKNLPLLSIALKRFPQQDKEWLKGLFKATIKGNYWEYINDPNTVAGQANINTKKAFETNGLNYENWLNYDGTKDFLFTATNSDEHFQTILNNFSSDLKVLLQDPAIKDELNNCINNLGYKFTGNKIAAQDRKELSISVLAKLIKNVDEFMTKHWQVAKDTNDQALLTIQDHFKQRLKDIEELRRSSAKPQKLKIERWKRQPGHDLFQGTYCQCCVALDGGNGREAPEALVNTVIQVAEIKETEPSINKDQPDEVPTKGKLELFWAKDLKTQQAILVGNSIEMAVGYQQNMSVRDAVAEYMRAYSKAVTGKDDVPLYIGKHYQDIPLRGLKDEKLEIQLIGTATNNEFYFDAINGGTWTEELDKPKTVELLRLDT